MAKDLSQDSILQKNRRLLQQESVKDNTAIDIGSQFSASNVNTNIRLTNAETLGSNNTYRVNANGTVENTNNLLDTNFKVQVQIDSDTNRQKDDPVFQTLYEDKGISTKALNKFQTQSANTISYTKSQIENKVRDRASELDIFLYDLLPYFGTSSVKESLSLANNVGSVAVTDLITNSLSTTISAVQKIKYFTPAELVAYFGSNFYTMHFLKGISVKKGQAGVLGINKIANETDVWTGYPDIYYGENNGTSFGYSDIVGAITQLGSSQKSENANVVLQKLKDGSGALSPEYNINSNQIKDTLKQNPTNILSNLNVKTVNYMNLSADVRQQILENGRWTNNTNPLSNVRESIAINDVINRQTNVTSGTANYINKNVNTINLKVYKSTGETIMNGDVKTLIKDKGFLQKDNKWQLGAIYVFPVSSDKTKLKSFQIPFEFNPDIQEGGIEAKYQATEIMSRIGALQSYINTGSITVTINANYFAVSHDATISDQGGQAWMSEFTLSRIQAIEMGLRSLVYPSFPDSQSVDSGYKYTRPPLIKIAMGDYTNETAPYGNLLSYQTSAMIGDARLKSSQKFGSKLLRTFIATSVTITKKLNETPVYLDDNLRIRDTFGFDVALNMVEVTPSYTDIPPDYLNYFSQYNNFWGQFVDSNSQPSQKTTTATTTSSTYNNPTSQRGA